MVKVAVILPSRGLMFSRTAEEVLHNVRYREKGFLAIPYKLFFAHRLPIPQCFESPTLQALADEEITHLWYVEDDMILPPDILRRMLDADKLVVTADYPVTKEGKGAVFAVSKQVLWCGTGCTLVKREVFDQLSTPYFRSDIRWTPYNYGKTIKLEGSMFGKDGYGLHDVTFGIKLLKAGIPIHVLGKVGQRKLVTLGKTGSNDGAHKVENWTKIVKNYQLKRIKAQPLALGAQSRLVTVDTPTGGVRVSRKHARNLIKQGLATPIDETKPIIDDLEVKW